ncbi:hypothetical protein [Clostridium fallax]|uniref:DUF8042 domain-containing protein n=1 Tax=Clostridium fallax TaxID=1533 RepID=A0A1M4UK63_9CLOT|nr:hypothetical protein [Clostridium fallax]SHE57126.1 hypothetical protein SAMN05443638_10567 [Clostridium fallax]SQB07612.1 Uncharacterised protein [Clostridium fallax]
MENKELKQMKIDTVITLDEYLNALIEDASNVAELFREDEISQGLFFISNISEAIEVVCQAVIEIQSILTEEFDLDNLNNFMNEMIQALENEDYILLGDLLEYEIIPILENLKINIEKTIKLNLN